LRIVLFQGGKNRVIQVEGDVDNVVFLGYEQLLFADVFPALYAAYGQGICYEKIVDVAGDIYFVQIAEFVL
jgi:hypothetical protein